MYAFNKMSESVRTTFDDEMWDEMVERAPAAIQDPEVVRHFVSIGLARERAAQRATERAVFKKYGLDPDEYLDSDTPQQDENGEETS